MKSNAETTKDQAAKDHTPKAKAPTSAEASAGRPKAKHEAASKVKKATKVGADAVPVDRLPATVEGLKESKSGLVTLLFLSGKDKEDIAKELKVSFKLTDGQAAKIVRCITGRARFFQRAFTLVAAK